MIKVVSGLRAEAASAHQVFKTVAVVTGWFALPQREDVGEADQHRHEGGDERHGEGHVQDDEQDEKHDDAGADSADETPKETAFQTPSAAFGIRRGVGVGQAKLTFGAHGGRVRVLVDLGLEIADANRAVGIEAEDFVEGIDHRRGCRDDRAADDGHLALVHIAAPDGEAAVDDGRDAEDESEHHDDGDAVADAGFQVGGTERRALGESGDGVEGEQGGHGEERTQTRAEFRSEYFFHIIVGASIHFYFCWRHTPPITRKVLATPKTCFV